MQLTYIFVQYITPFGYFLIGGGSGGGFLGVEFIEVLERSRLCAESWQQATIFLDDCAKTAVFASEEWLVSLSLGSQIHLRVRRLSAFTLYFADMKTLR